MKLKYILEILTRVLCPPVNRFYYQRMSLKKKRYLLKIDKTSETNFDLIYENNFWTSKESGSGLGSVEETTQKIREALPVLFKKYNIKSVLDAPCGDYNWMKLVDKQGIDYIGCDIVKSVIEANSSKYSDQNVKFLNLNLTKDDLPCVDLILCRDCFQHIVYDDILKIINNFKRSKSKYLLTTSYPLTYKNWDIKINGDYRPLNISKSPINLKNHIEKIKENGGVGGAVDRILYLFDIAKLEI